MFMNSTQVIDPFNADYATIATVRHHSLVLSVRQRAVADTQHQTMCHQANAIAGVSLLRSEQDYVSAMMLQHELRPQLSRLQGRAASN